MPRFHTALILMTTTATLFASGCREEVPPHRLHGQSIAPPSPAKPKIVTGSITKPEAKTETTTEATMTPESAIVGSAAWCAQRHVDAAEGRAPGGATVLAQKEAHDGICEQQRGITGPQ